MFNWLIKLLGGIPKDDYKKLESDYKRLTNKYSEITDKHNNLKKEYADFEAKSIALQSQADALQSQTDALEAKISYFENKLAEYATISFPDTGEYNFSVNSKCPYSLMVKKGTELTITGYKGTEKLDKINVEEG